MSLKQIMITTQLVSLKVSNKCNFSSVISCYPGPEENTHSEITYLMTRDREWGPNNREKVEELLETIRSWGIEIDSLHETKQSDCNYGLIP